MKFLDIGHNQILRKSDYKYMHHNLMYLLYLHYIYQCIFSSALLVILIDSYKAQYKYTNFKFYNLNMVLTQFFVKYV